MRQDKIAVACAYLPLSESMLIPKEFGTRHRAAVGVSEVSDALTVVVSEETGDISISLNNELRPGLSQEEFLDLLQAVLVSETTDSKIGILQSFIDGVSGVGKGGKK